MPKRAEKARKRPSSRRRLVLLLIAICGVSIVAGILAFDRLPSTIGDNAEFAILGRALAAGQGFRYTNHPDARPATKYPPGFPLMLASWIKVFGDSMVSLKIHVVACYVAAMAITLLVGRKLVGDALGLMASLLVALSWPVLMYSHQVLSDVPYMLFSLIVVLLLLDRRLKRSAVIAGIAVSLWAYFVRTAGVSLIVAVVVLLLLRRKRKEALLLALGFGVVSALWSVRNYTMTGEGSRYATVLLSANPYDPDKGLITFAGLMRRGWTNLVSYVGHLIPINIFPSLVTTAGDSAGAPLRTLVSVLIMAVAGLGGYALRARAQLVNIYVLAYLAVYLAWPEVWRGERFMIPIAPIIAILFFAGFKKILEYFEVKRLILLVLCSILILTNGPTLVRFWQRERGYPAGWSNYLETAVWVRENTAEDALVMCRKPFMFHIFSDRKTISYPFTHDRETMRSHLMTSRPGYIVIEDFGGVSATQVYLVPVLEDMVGYLARVYSTEEPVSMVLRFSPPHAGDRQ